MTRIPSIFPALAATAALTCAGAHAQTATSPPNAVKVPDSKIVQTIDCHGADLTVTGDDDRLGISGCVTINVVGNHNSIRAQLLPTSTIAALGNNNHIVFLHAAGFEARVTSSGRNNEIVPQMGRDSNATSPVKFPLGSH